MPAARSAQRRWKTVGLGIVFGLLAAACATNPQPDATSAPASAESASEADSGSSETASTVVDTGTSSDEPAATVESDAAPAVDTGAEQTSDRPAISPDVTIPSAQTELVSGNVAFGGGQGGGSLVELLDVSLPTVANGEEFPVGSLLGQDAVLWFWAPWCSWCNAEANRVSALATEFDGEVVLNWQGRLSEDEIRDVMGQLTGS